MVRIIAPLCLAGLAYAGRVQESQWQTYKAKFGKSYTTAEDSRRYGNYISQMEEIERHNERANSGLESYWQGETQFTDMLAEEVKRLMNGYGKGGTPHSLGIEKQYPCNDNFHPSGYMPDDMNWVNEGAVTCIKNQEYCGDCWAFSAAACMEGAVYMAHGKLQSLSAQEITDCASSNTEMGVYSNSGCDGGYPQNAFYFSFAIEGMESWLEYPFADIQNACQYNASLEVARFSSCVDVTFGDETTLAYAVAEVGPISVAIDAGLTSFHNYVAGVYYAPNCSPNELDHAVTAVGFGVMPELDPSISAICTVEDFMCVTMKEGIKFEFPCMTAARNSQKVTPYLPGQDCNPPDGVAGERFWMVKNSWGPTWGMSGYILMAKDKSNNCGIASAPSYVIADY